MSVVIPLDLEPRVGVKNGTKVRPIQVRTLGASALRRVEGAQRRLRKVLVQFELVGSRYDTGRKKVLLWTYRRRSPSGLRG